MKDEIEILIQTSAPRFQKQTGLKYQMHLLDTPREMWEKINSWRAGMTCADHRRLVFLLCVRLVCSSLYSCVFGWIDFLFLWLSSGSSCFTEMKETCRFSRYTLNQPWDTETAVYTEPQISHVFFKIPKNIATAFFVWYHTWYLSRAPRACSCKIFLAGVIFYIFNAKNWQFTVYFAVITQKIGNLLCILS